MSYRNLDINLLPPELRPGPAVRYRVIIIWAIILVTVAFLMVDSYFGLSRISQRREVLDVANRQVQQLDFIQEEYNALMQVENYVMQTGKLVSMASADYVDLPLVANRIANVLPDGVFLERITNNRPNKGSNNSEITVVLVSSSNKPDLVIETLNRFKSDSMLGNCYMRIAEQQTRPLSPLLSLADINWVISGPELESKVDSDHYSFEIHTLITTPVDSSDSQVIFDDSKYLAGFQREEVVRSASGLAPAEENLTDSATTAPAGVEVEEAY